MSKSKLEEILMLLSFVVSLLAYQNDLMLMAKMFFVKGLFDFGCASYYAYRELKAEKKI